MLQPHIFLDVWLNIPELKVPFGFTNGDGFVIIDINHLWRIHQDLTIDHFEAVEGLTLGVYFLCLNVSVVLCKCSPHKEFTEFIRDNHSKIVCVHSFSCMNQWKIRAKDAMTTVKHNDSKKATGCCQAVYPLQANRTIADNHTLIGNFIL